MLRIVPKRIAPGRTGADVMEFNRHQFLRLGHWFDEAAGLPPAQRQIVLHRVRQEAGDELADELAAMLEAHDQPTGTMDLPLARLNPPCAPSAFRDGQIVLGRFQIVRLLGRGGMGEVYEALDREMGPVALKTIRPDLLGNRAMLQRFKQEVQLAREVTSPHVCRIHEFFPLTGAEAEHAAAFLTMELLRGQTLAARLEHGPIPWSDAQSIALDLCRGLQALHEAGLVHRDFKPGNAMLVQRGALTQAVVMDLGLATRPATHAPGDQHLTITGAIVGTPGYMAPEQFEGAILSPATDIYALGLVLYEITTARRPFEARTPLAAAIQRGKRFPPASSLQPDLPRALDSLIEKCLAFEPSARFASAGLVEDALLALLSSPATAEKPQPFLSRRALLLCGSGAAVAGAAALWSWPKLESWTNPLPLRRFVAAMAWPKPLNEQAGSLISQLLTTISRELARAEAHDRNFLILENGEQNNSTGSTFTADTPVEIAGVLGANLVLAASVPQPAKAGRILLSLLDPANPSHALRHASVFGEAATLSARVVAAAARLLSVHTEAEQAGVNDEFSQVPAAAYQLFRAAEEERRRPNNAGLNAAIGKYQAALREDPRFTAAYAALAIAYEKRFTLTRDAADRTLAERNSQLALEYGPSSSRARFSHALIALHSGGTEQALRVFQDLLNADPGNEEIMMLEARAFKELNKPELEEKIYRHLLLKRPNFWPAYNDLGLLYRRQGGKYDEAVRYFLQATAIAPQAAIPWTNLGAAYFLAGNTEEARKACQKAIDNHPGEDALTILGDIAYESRDYRKALDYFQRARDINPKGHIVWQSLGDCYTMLRQPAQSRECYRKASDILTAQLQVNPRPGRDWMILAYYSAKLGDRPLAAKQLGEAEKRGAGDQESQLVKAQIHVLFGESQKAVELTLDLLNHGISRVDLDLAIDLQGVLTDPRLRAVLQRAK